MFLKAGQKKTEEAACFSSILAWCQKTKNCGVMVDTWTLKGVPHQHFGAHVSTVMLHGAFGRILAQSHHDSFHPGTKPQSLTAGFTLNSFLVAFI